MTENSVKVERRERALWITLNRPEAMNALSPEMVNRIKQALQVARDDSEIRCVVLTGAGQAFCAGADLSALPRTADSAQHPAMGAFLADANDMMDRLQDLPKPVIAAVNGLALAGGLELVLCVDLVIAARSARFGDSHANFGLLPGGGGSARLPRAIGKARAKYLLYTGSSVTADQFSDLGGVSQVVEDGELAREVERLVEKIVAKSPLGLRRMKALVDQGVDLPLNAALANERLTNEIHASSHDMQEGLAAFAEKRRPNFLGH